MNMSPNKKTAKAAGLLYLILAITDAFSLIYIPSHPIPHLVPHCSC
jgi:hypothetical protein